MTSDESGCFDPNRTLIVALNGRTVVDVLTKFEKLGNIESFQHLDDSDSLLLMYDTSNNELRNIIADVKGEDVTPLSEIIDTRYQSLSVPGLVKNFLISPPPSPPEGWTSIREDINRIAHTDLIEQKLDNGSIELVTDCPKAPSIIVHPEGV